MEKTPLLDIHHAVSSHMFSAFLIKKLFIFIDFSSIIKNLVWCISTAHNDRNGPKCHNQQTETESIRLRTFVARQAKGALIQSRSIPLNKLAYPVA